MLFLDFTSKPQSNANLRGLPDWLEAHRLFPEEDVGNIARFEVYELKGGEKAPEQETFCKLEENSLYKVHSFGQE